MNTGTFSVFAQTDVGKVRKNNEDSFLVADITSEHSSSMEEIYEIALEEKGSVLMVSDGMGGAAAGEVASLIAVTTVQKELQHKRASDEQEFIVQLVSSLEKANRNIKKKSAEQLQMSGMGATATLAGFFNNKVFIGQVGDSRAYLLRNKTIIQMTKDQSYVNQLVEAGELTEEEAENHPKKNIILQALGTQQSIKVAVTSLNLQQNDYLLLCSDGLTGFVRKDEIKSIILSSSDITSACGRLIDLAKDRGGRDNITVIIVLFSEKSHLPPPGQEVVDYIVLSDFTFPSL